MSIKVEQISGTGSCEVTGGFSNTEISVGFLENLENLTEPKPRCGPGAGATLEELIEINATHTFKAGFGFTKIKAILETVGLESNQIGTATKSPAVENKLTVQVKGSLPEILGYDRLIRGRDLIVIAPEFASGNKRQIGSAKFAAQLSEAPSVIEATIDGENITTWVFMDKQTYKAPIYNGDITEQPAV